MVFLSLYKKFIYPYLEYSIQANYLILCRNAEALKKVQKLALMFVKGLRNVPYETALKQLRLFSITHRRTRGDLLAMSRLNECVTGNVNEEGQLLCPLSSSSRCGPWTKALQ